MAEQIQRIMFGECADGQHEQCPSYASGWIDGQLRSAGKHCSCICHKPKSTGESKPSLAKVAPLSKEEKQTMTTGKIRVDFTTTFTSGSSMVLEVPIGATEEQISSLIREKVKSDVMLLPSVEEAEKVGTFVECYEMVGDEVVSPTGFDFTLD